MPHSQWRGSVVLKMKMMTLIADRTGLQPGSTSHTRADQDISGRSFLRSSPAPLRIWCSNRIMRSRASPTRSRPVAGGARHVVPLSVHVAATRGNCAAGAFDAQFHPCLACRR
eukprot:15843_5